MTIVLSDKINEALALIENGASQAHLNAKARDLKFYARLSGDSAFAALAIATAAILEAERP